MEPQVRLHIHHILKKVDGLPLVGCSRLRKHNGERTLLLACGGAGTLLSMRATPGLTARLAEFSRRGRGGPGLCDV